MSPVEIHLWGVDTQRQDPPALFWLKDRSLIDLDNLPEPDELAEEIIENPEAGLDSFREVLVAPGKGTVGD